MTTTDLQGRLAQVLGVDVTGDNFHIAAARLYEVIWPAIGSHESEDPASQRQVAFAKDIGLDIVGVDRATASQQIGARLGLLNELALRTLDLKPGDRVVLKENPKESCVVSCVGRNRKVYLKGWGGQSV
jgi:hypothetical protein